MKKKQFFIIFCFILLDAFILIGFLVVRDATSFNELKNEVNELSKLDVTKDRYNRKIKSSGDYAVVEKTIKEYLDGYAVDIQYISKMMKDENLSTILSYDNYVNDGPGFKKSIEYLEKSKKEYNDKMDEMINNLEDENINNYISSKIDDAYYVSLCNELMFDTKLIDNIRDTEKLLIESRDKMNNIYDTSLEVLNYLVLYKDSWKLEDGEIKFQTEDMYNYYIGLISKVQEQDN